MIFDKKEQSAKVAKDRLTVMLATERGSNALPHMEDIKREILEVIKKYTKVKKISIKTDNNQNIDLLEVEIILDK